MEPAKIDWKSLDSVFVFDDLYEHLNAPKWVDFSAPEEAVDDEAWFCRPDCRHPKTTEDFVKSAPTPKSKVTRSAQVPEILPLGERNRRDANLKRRGPAQSSFPSKNSPKPERFNEDSENQNPNLSTPPLYKSNSTKTKIKSSAEKKKLIHDTSQNDEAPQLKSTLSARNLFAGRDILNQITEFCHELKRLATRTKERENLEKRVLIEEVDCENLVEADERERDIKPFVDVNKEEIEAMEKGTGKQRKKRTDDAENIPLAVDVKSNVRRGEESLLQIRTCPPSPQCFSVTREQPTRTTTLSKPSKFRHPAERGVPQELEQSSSTERGKDQTGGDRGNNARSVNVSIVAERHAKPLDVFWLFKPCTLTS